MGSIFPGLAFDIAPKGDPLHRRVFPQDRKLFLVPGQLRLVIAGHVEFRNIDGQSGVGQHIQDRSHRTDAHIIHVEVMALNADAVDQPPAVEQLDDLHILGGCVGIADDPVIIDEQFGIGESLPGLFEGPNHPVPPRCSVPSDGILIGGRGVQGFVDHIHKFGIAVALPGRLNPLDQLRPLLRGGKAAHPTGLLAPPYQRVKLKGKSVFLSVIVGHVRLRPIHAAPGGFDGFPFRRIFRGDLIPIRSEVRGNIICNHIS